MMFMSAVGVHLMGGFFSHKLHGIVFPKKMLTKILIVNLNIALFL